MTITPDKELEAIRQVMELLAPFPPQARKRILGYVTHFLKARVETPREGA
jgi:hypothetical protein